MEEATKTVAKDMQKGVYTVTCGVCGSATYVHVDSEEGIDPVSCRDCKGVYLRLEQGERNNEYVAVISEEEESEEKPKMRAAAMSKASEEEIEETDEMMVKVDTTKKRKVKLTSLQKRQRSRTNRKG